MGTVSGMSLRDSIKNRQARPLNGLELKEAISNHIIRLSDNLLSKHDIKSNKVIELTDILKEDVSKSLNVQSRLKLNITYPKVGWKSTVRLIQLEDKSYIVNGEIELDLERNVRLNLQFGNNNSGITIGSIEDEKIPTSIPDKDREKFNLPINIEHINSNGDSVKTDLRTLRKSDETPKIAARSVDVGSAAIDKVEVGKTIEVTQSVDGTPASSIGNIKIELPIEELLPTPPNYSKAPLTTPLPDSGSMNKNSKPNVKFKR